MRTVVVTGASTGIGAATAKLLVAAGCRVFGSVRRAGDAERLRETLGPAFVPLLFDVTDRAAIEAAARVVGDALSGTTLFGLINNAGAAVLGPLLHLAPEDLHRQLDVNLVGQLQVTQAFAPLLGADPARVGPPGRVGMISSVAGRNASPFMGAYCASKFGLEGLSECLRRELMLFGIGVIVIAPGPIATPIWDKAAAQDLTPLARSPYLPAIARAREVIDKGRLGYPPERVGELVLHALTARRPRARYTITPRRLEQLLIDWLPRRLIDRVVAMRLGLRRA